LAAAIDGGRYDTELDSKYIPTRETIALNKSALLLIDVWENHPNDGWTERARGNVATKIAPLLDRARRNQMTILHAPHRQTIARDARPLPGEINLDDADLASTEALDRFLRLHGIQTLFYAGYATNLCVLNRPVGIIRMSQRGYKIILVRDATIALETPETLHGEWQKTVAIDMVEQNWGVTTTLADLEGALTD
jgi:nicotinamidase-related amidase